MAAGSAISAWSGLCVQLSPACPSALSQAFLFSALDSVPLPLCHCRWSGVETSAPLQFALALSPPSFISSVTYSSLTESGRPCGVLAGHWSAPVPLSLGHHLLAFLLPPVSEAFFHFHRVCPLVRPLCSCLPMSSPCLHVVLIGTSAIQKLEPNFLLNYQS